jgi:hypothetical protein
MFNDIFMDHQKIFKLLENCYTTNLQGKQYAYNFFICLQYFSRFEKALSILLRKLVVKEASPIKYFILKIKKFKIEKYR